jgi:hypothetical protein
MKNPIIFKVLIISTFICLGQSKIIYSQKTWAKTYGDEGWNIINSIEPVSDGGYICTGYTDSYRNGDVDGWLVRLNSLGDTLWTKTYGDTIDESLKYVAAAPDNGFIVLGIKGLLSGDENDLWLLKINSSGDTILTRRFGGDSFDHPTSILQTPDGGYLVSCFYRLIKINTDLDTLWTKTYGAYFRTTKILKAADGGYFLFGLKYIDSNWTTSILKISSSGDSLWNKTYPEVNHGHSASDIINTNDNGFLFGITIYPNSLLMKIDSEGNKVWLKNMGDIIRPLSEYIINTIFSINKSADGGYVITGLKDSELYILKLSETLDFLWNQFYFRSRDPLSGIWSAPITQTSDKGFLITTSASLPKKLSDLWLLKTDSLGNIFYQFSTSVIGKGKIDPPQGKYNMSSRFDLKAIPDAGWKFYKWSGDIPSGNIYDKEIFFFIDTNKSITAEFMQSNSIDDYHSEINKNVLNSYPNPFSSVTEISYTVKSPGQVKLTVFDVFGNEIVTLVNAYRQTGQYSTLFNPDKLKSGIYYCKMENGNIPIGIIKMILLK